MAPAEDGPEPRAAQVDDPPSFVKGVKGRKDMHVPKAVWRQHRPRKPRAADHVEGTGSKGGPTSARVINGVLRSLEELAIACPRNLKRWGLASEDEYFEHVRRRDVAKAALDADWTNRANTYLADHGLQVEVCAFYTSAGEGGAYPRLFIQFSKTA